MVIYLDLVFFINFGFDFLLLLTLSIVLKRKTKIYRMIIASLIGALSIFVLFININSLELFLIKFIISILMILIGFGFKDYKYFFNNMVYLYMISIVLGGFLYLLNLEFSYKNDGLIFFYDNNLINSYILIIFAPIILYIYIRQSKKLKFCYSNYYNVRIKYLNKVYDLVGYVDSGNNLHDQYKRRPIILINDRNFKYDYSDLILVPYETVSGKGVIKCFRPSEVSINKKEVKNVLVGVSDVKFMLDGVTCILNKDIMGGIEC